MASVANAFNLLTGAEQQLATKKKKKNNKAKAGEAVANGNHAAVASSVTSNGHAAAPAPPAPVPTLPTASQNLVVDVTEACALTEAAARNAKSVQDKMKLFKEWTRLSGDKSAKALKYVDADGTSLDFKQVVLRGKALEICAEGCVTAGLTGERESTVAQMFASFLPNDSNECNHLANLLVRMSGVLCDEAPDAVGAAQRAVHNIVAALKNKAASGGSGVEADSGNPVEAWLNRINFLDREIAKQSSSLQKLGAANKGAVTRETTNTARALVKLHVEKFDLLQPSNIPVAKAPEGMTGACVRSLEELKAVITSHLKITAHSAPAPAQEAESAASHGPSSAAAQAAVGNYKREEEILNAQATQVASQIRTLEAQLHGLRAQQMEIEERRASVASRQRVAWESTGGGGRSKAQGQPTLTPAHYREELAIAESLQDMMDPRRSSRATPEHVLAVQTAQVGTPLQYVADGEGYLTLALQALQEVPARLAFCKQRVAQAAKLAQLGSFAAAGKLQSDPKRSAEEAEQLLQDTMRMAEELVATAGSVRSDVHIRYDSMARFNPEKASQVAGHIRNIDTLAVQIQQQYNAILSGTATVTPVAPAQPAPAPAAAPAPAPAYKSAPGPQQRAVGNGAVPSAAPQPVSAPVPAPAPAAAVPAAGMPAAPPPRQWAKVQQQGPAAGDDSLPTPAEAFKGPPAAGAGPSTSADAEGFHQAAGGKKNRRKA